MYYGVRQGRTPGIFDNWDDCKRAVDGYPNADFKKFKTEDEAIEYVCGHLENKKTNDYFWNKKRIVCKDTGEVVFGYRDYLKTRHWKEKRKSVYERFNGVCCRCGEQFSLTEMQVHHKTYHNLGNEKDQDLILYCRRCHSIVEQHKTKKKKDDKNFTAFLGRVAKELTKEEKKELQEYISKKYHIT